MLYPMWPWLKKHKKEMFLIAGAIILYLLLCLYDLTKASLWFDEAYSVWIIGFPPLELLSITAQDIHPPLYYLILQGWSLLFGNSEWAIRCLSVLFGAGVVIVSYGITRQLLRAKYAWLVPYFVAISPMLVRYGREARMYTLLTLLIVVAIYIVIRASSANNERRLWRVHGLIVGLGLLTHYLMPIYWVAQWVWVALKVYRSGERRWRQIVMPSYWKSSCLVTLLTAAVWLPIILTAAATKQIVGFWIPPVNLVTLGDTVTRTFTYEPIAHLAWWEVGLVVIAVTTVLFTLLYILRKRLVKNNTQMSLLVISVIVPPALLVILSLPPLVSKYYDRYLVPSMVIGSIVIAVLCVATIASKKYKIRLLGATLAITYLMLSAIGITNVYLRGNYNEFDGTTSVRQIMSEIKAIDNQSPVYIVNPGIAVIAEYYGKQEGLVVYGLNRFVAYEPDDIKRSMIEVQAAHKEETIWVIDHVRPQKVSMRPMVWEAIPRAWHQQDDIRYDYSPDEPSYRAVRYTVK